MHVYYPLLGELCFHVGVHRIANVCLDPARGPTHIENRCLYAYP